MAHPANGFASGAGGVRAAANAAEVTTRADGKPRQPH
jgi:hypothetical protein